MARIAFVLLCHKNPVAIVQQARQLTAVGDYIAIHFDASASPADYDLILRQKAGEMRMGRMEPCACVAQRD